MQRPTVTRPTPAPKAWAEPYFTVGVTGTNGKTSTTHLVAAALAHAGPGCVTISTLGYFAGDERNDGPRTHHRVLETLRAGAERGIVRAALECTSKALAEGYAKRWRFDAGVFTNLSPDHLETHGSWEHYLAAKAQLFTHLGPGCRAVLNAADPGSLLLDRVIPADVHRWWYAASSRGEIQRAPDLMAERIEVSLEGTRVDLARSPLAEALGGSLSTRLVGEVFGENLMAAALGALAAGIEPAVVAAGLQRCPPLPGRFEVVSRAPTVVVDYAHSPDALARTCETARRLAGDGRVIVVFGAGGGRTPEKREPMGAVVGGAADLAVVTTDNPRHEDPAAIAAALAQGCRRGGRARVRVELDRRRAIERAIAEARTLDVVVVAGKGHETGQLVGDTELPFSDVEEVARITKSRRAP